MFAAFQVCVRRISNGEVILAAPYQHVNLPCPYINNQLGQLKYVLWHFRNISNKTTEIVNCTACCATSKYRLLFDDGTDQQDKVIQLTILDARPGDSGTYTCRLVGTNGYTHAQTELRVDVVEFIIPVECSFFRDLNVSEEEQQVFLVHDSGSHLETFSAHGASWRPAVVDMRADLSHRTTLASVGESGAIFVAFSCCMEISSIVSTDSDTNGETLCATPCNTTLQFPPNPPTSLRIMDSSSSSFRLSWIPGPNGSSAAVIFSVTACPVSPAAVDRGCLTLKNITGSAAELTNLRGYTQYSVEVAASNGLGSSKNNPSITATTAPDVVESYGIRSLFDVETGKLSISSEGIVTLPHGLCIHVEFRVLGFTHRNETCLLPGDTIFVKNGFRERQLWLRACDPDICGRPSEVTLLSPESGKHGFPLSNNLLLSTSVGLAAVLIVFIGVTAICCCRRRQSHTIVRSSHRTSSRALPKPAQLPAAQMTTQELCQNEPECEATYDSVSVPSRMEIRSAVSTTEAMSATYVASEVNHDYFPMSTINDAMLPDTYITRIVRMDKGGDDETDEVDGGSAISGNDAVPAKTNEAGEEVEDGGIEECTSPPVCISPDNVISNDEDFVPQTCK
ncbi:uncharacterized protein [Diadema setosum]|uniref:uncharacterized protein n=1 Tax=Diadema setosum TaxID=31175 RepID=UPI003B3B8AD9